MNFVESPVRVFREVVPPQLRIQHDEIRNARRDGRVSGFAFGLIVGIVVALIKGAV